MAWLIRYFKSFFPNLFARLTLWVGGIFSAIGPAFAALWLKLTTNLGKIVAGVLAIGGFLLAFMYGLNAIAKGVSVVLPSQYIQFAQMFIPDNTSLCISALVSAKLAQVIMVWKVRLAEFFMGA